MTSRSNEGEKRNSLASLSLSLSESLSTHDVSPAAFLILHFSVFGGVGVRISLKGRGN